MRHALQMTAAVAVALVLTAVLLTAGPASAQEQPGPAGPPHQPGAPPDHLIVRPPTPQRVPLPPGAVDKLRELGQMFRVAFDAALKVLSGNEMELFSGNQTDLLSRNRAALLSGNSPELLSGNSPRLLSGNSPTLLSGNSPRLLSGNRPKLLSENQTPIFSGNRISILSNLKIEIRIVNSGNNRGSQGAAARPLGGAPLMAPPVLHTAPNTVPPGPATLTPR